MGIKDQNNMDTRFEKLIKDLKGLPKVDAPDDFEYKLMIKIQNGQFESEKLQKESGKLWGFIPATAIALSALIIFFVVKETSVEPENPYFDGVEQPLQIADNIPDTINLGAPATSGTSEESYAVIHPNDVVKQERVNRPKPQLQGVDVDNLIDGSIRNRSSNRNQQVVGHGRQRFNGFLIEVEKDRKEIAMLRARLDSIKTAKEKKKIEK